jgi:hypothetical protein
VQHVVPGGFGALVAHATADIAPARAGDGVLGVVDVGIGRLVSTGGARPEGPPPPAVLASPSLRRYHACDRAPGDGQSSSSRQVCSPITNSVTGDRGKVVPPLRT